MKLKVKATGETLEVAPDSYVCGLRPDGNEVEFLAEDVEIIPNDWDAFRREAAKDILCSMVRGGYGWGREAEQARLAVSYAGELIKALKKE